MSSCETIIDKYVRHDLEWRNAILKCKIMAVPKLGTSVTRHSYRHLE